MSETRTTKPWSFEVCRDCGRDNVVGFRVTDSMWARVVGEEMVLCIFCFDVRATLREIDWTEEPIEWYPVSTVANRLWGEIEQTGPHRA